METAEVKDQDDSKSFEYVIDNLIHIFIIALLFYILWIPIFHYKYLLSWHAILGTFAFLFLMSESITLLSTNPWFTKFVTTTREKKIWTHGILFTTATVFAVLSVYLEYYRKQHKDKREQHFHTAHGVTALLATILTVIAFCTGVSVGNCHKFQERIRPVVVKLVHNVFGQLAYGLGMISLACAYYSNWVMSRTTMLERAALVILTSFITSWILINAVKSLYHQIKAVKG